MDSVLVNGIQVGIIGREQQLSQIRSALANRQSFQLVGHHGVGKTTLLQLALQECGSDPGIVAREAPPDYSVDAFSWWAAVDLSFGADPNNLGASYYEVLVNSGQTPYLFCDDLDVLVEHYATDSTFASVLYEALQTGLRIACASAQPLTYATQDSMLASQLSQVSVVNVGALNDADTQLVAASIFGLDALHSTVYHSVAASGGVPGVLKDAYEEILKNPGDLNSAFEKAYLKTPWVRTRVARTQVL